MFCGLTNLYLLQANNKGVGVIGVIECNFLDPTHNKQSFIETDKYRYGLVHITFFSLLKVMSQICAVGYFTEKVIHYYAMISESVCYSNSKTISSLGKKLEDYWNEIRHKRKEQDPNSIPVEDVVCVHYGTA